MPRALARLVLLALALGLAVSGCGAAAGDPAGGDADPDAGVPRADLTSAIAPDPAAVALLPPQVRAAGVLTVGTSISTPPTAFHLADNRTAVGQDVDISEAVARPRRCTSPCSSAGRTR